MSDDIAALIVSDSIRLNKAGINPISGLRVMLAKAKMPPTIRLTPTIKSAALKKLTLPQAWERVGLACELLAEDETATASNRSFIGVFLTTAKSLESMVSVAVN